MSLISASYDYRLVALSILIAIFASYTTLDLVGRVRANRGRSRLAWLMGGAIAMGSGIWAMHFTGMLALRFPIPVYYHVPTVVLSLLAAVLASWIALYVVSRDPLTPLHLGVGSFLMGIGIATMHYTGMAAMHLAAMHHYDRGLLVLSVILAIVISFAGLLLISSAREENHPQTRKLAIAVVMGLAIPVMHYTGMSAVTFVPSDVALDLSRSVSISALAIAAILVATFIVSGFALITSLVDRRLSVQQTILDEERQRLRALIDNIPDFMYVKDRQSRFVIANAHTADVLGAGSVNELLGKTDFDFFPRDVATAFYVDEQEVMRSGRPLCNHEENGLDANGNGTCILTTKVPLRDGKGRIFGVAGVGRDIGERKKSEEALRVAHQQAEFFINAVPSILIGLDSESRVTRWNLAASREFGLPVSSVFRKTLADCGIKWLQKDLEREIRTWCSDGRPRRELVPFERKGQSRTLGLVITPVQMADEDLTRVLVIGSDITERVKAEEALREAERKYRGIFDDAIVGIFQITPDGRYLSANPAMARILGYDSPEELIANSADISHPLYVNAKRGDELKLLLDETGVVQNFECEVYRKDGGRIWIATSGRAIRCDGGLVRYEGMNEDVTERKLLQSQLLQVQKLESVGQLAAGIAHEINTPTQYIGDNVRFLKDAFRDLRDLLGNYAQLLAAVKRGSCSLNGTEKVQATIEGTDANYLLDEIPKAIEQTLEGVTRVATLVNAMKEFSHPGQKEKTALDLNHAIETTITVARNEWKYVADLETDFDPSLPPTSCQPGEFNQVVLNLIVNAAHAIADAVGKERSAKGRIRVITRNYPDWVEIRIQDSGVGIPDHIRGRIFDPFFTTKEIGRGTGQGLAIARSVIVDKHEGSIDFETEEGVGTTFIIRLPHDGKTLAAKTAHA